MNALNAQHSDVMRQLHREQEAALASLREQLGNAADAKTEALLAHHKSEIDALKAAAQEAAAAAEKAQVAAVAAQKNGLDDENLVKKMSDLDARLKQSCCRSRGKGRCMLRRVQDRN